MTCDIPWQYFRIVIFYSSGIDDLLFANGSKSTIYSAFAKKK